LLCGFVFSQAWGRSVIATAAMSGREIVAHDAGGREVWRVTLPQVDGSIVPARMMVADLEGDGSPEVLAALHFMRYGRGDEGVLMAIDSRGAVLWQRALDDRYRFGNAEYGPTWFPVDIVVYGGPGQRRISVAYHHHTWWPGLVVTFDAAGAPIARFVNSGWITSLNVAADGRHLLAAGMSNGFGGAMLAVLDVELSRGIAGVVLSRAVDRARASLRHRAGDGADDAGRIDRVARGPARAGTGQGARSHCHDLAVARGHRAVGQRLLRRAPPRGSARCAEVDHGCWLDERF
jgi:hypothetical protein